MKSASSNKPSSSVWTFNSGTAYQQTPHWLYTARELGLALSTNSSLGQRYPRFIVALTELTNLTASGWKQKSLPTGKHFLVRLNACSKRKGMRESYWYSTRE